MEFRLSQAALVVCALVFAGALPGCSRSANAPNIASDVTLAGRLDQTHVSSESPSEIMAHLQVKLADGTDRPRPNANLALVIDSSGSMKGEALAGAKKAAQRMVDALRDGDRLAIVIFHSHAEVLLASVPIDDDERAAAKRHIDAIEARGTTDMANGLARGLDEVKRHHDPGTINRIVLLGDGIPNSVPEVRNLANDAASSAITITAFGLGDEYDETLMGEIAQLSGGRFHYVDTPEATLAFFEREALRLDSVVARNAQLRLTPGPGVTIVGVVGQQMQREGLATRVALGDMSRGDVRDLVVRVEAAPHKPGASVELVDALLTFDDPAGVPVERRVYLDAVSSDDSAALERGRDAEVAKVAARAVAAAETLEAIQQHRQGDGATARKKLEQAAASARQKAQASGDRELEAQAEQMDQLGKAIADEPPPPKRSPADPTPNPAAPQGEGNRSQERHPKVVRQAHDEAMQRLQ